MALSFDRADLSAGCVVHIFNRGNDRSTIFKTESDYHWFLTKAKALSLYQQFDVIAYCLMPNHFHYFLRLKTDENISVFFQRLQLAYAKYFNRKYSKSGHVFSGPFRSVALNDFKHFTYLPKYIHLNPVKAKLVERPEDWPFSNFVDLIQERETAGIHFYSDTYGDISEYLRFVHSGEDDTSEDFKAITFE